MCFKVKVVSFRITCIFSMLTVLHFQSCKHLYIKHINLFEKFRFLIALNGYHVTRIWICIVGISDIYQFSSRADGFECNYEYLFIKMLTFNYHKHFQYLIFRSFRGQCLRVLKTNTIQSINANLINLNSVNMFAAGNLVTCHNHSATEMEPVFAIVPMHVN